VNRACMESGVCRCPDCEPAKRCRSIGCEAIVGPGRRYCQECEGERADYERDSRKDDQLTGDY
jgi:hypothetical protein